ncbi:hypothetical protein TNCV_4183191 [Trichonephila clavipes]|nr:hypothetical protein TNCV_4183191 [Trichonephila clavipes]
MRISHKRLTIWKTTFAVLLPIYGHKCWKNSSKIGRPDWATSEPANQNNSRWRGTTHRPVKYQIGDKSPDGRSAPHKQPSQQISKQRCQHEKSCSETDRAL